MDGPNERKLQLEKIEKLNKLVSDLRKKMRKMGKTKKLAKPEKKFVPAKNTGIILEEIKIPPLETIKFKK